MIGMLIAVVASLSPMRGGNVNYRPMRVFDDAAECGRRFRLGWN